MLELLAPAKNAEQGIEAIRHGADAVYIGAPAFGARAAAPVSLEDISRVIDYAHLFDAKVYVALNTILYPEEVPKAIELSWKLDEIGADALIIQDLALLGKEMPHIAIHASTQMDNVSAEKLALWSQIGIEQAVVARELSPRQIASLHRSVPDLRLEAFVHGALCVSYSGRCYAASAFHERSANRGACSQVCRLPYDLIDGNGRLLVRNKHLLSIKDLNRSGVLNELIEAGVRSFKIEGRLKDLSYVKNVTAYYSNLLNQFISDHPQFSRSSRGNTALKFSPNIGKTFSRGFTTFTHRGRSTDDLAAFLTPKSVGEEIGVVKKIDGKVVTVNLHDRVALHNGDGFSFFSPKNGVLTGFRANTVDGDRLHLSRPIFALDKGTKLYRNLDSFFEAEMSRRTATRTIPLSMTLDYKEGELSLRGETSGIGVTVLRHITLEPARDDGAKDSTEQVLSKLGGTNFGPVVIAYNSEEAKRLFIPRSFLAEIRRELISCLESALKTRAYKERSRRDPGDPKYETIHFYKTEVIQSDNILNPGAIEFVESHGAEVTEMAFEDTPLPDQPLMTTKHCIRYSLGMCPTLQGYDQRKLHDPWVLRCASTESRPVEMRIVFDCPRCQMLLYKA